MGKFRTLVTLLQPSVATGGQPTEHEVMARRYDEGGGDVGIVDDAIAAPSGATWELDRPPRGLGTRWRALVDGVPHQIDSVVMLEQHRGVARVSLSSTALTGDLAIPGPRQSGSPPASPPRGAPGSGS